MAPFPLEHADMNDATQYPAAPTPRFESFADLKARGIPYSRVHLGRLIEASAFPKPIKLSDGGRIAFLSTELDQWMADRAAARDETAA
jgi:prophage regulatory protein